MKKVKEAENLLGIGFSTYFSLVGIGAPIHIFLPEVAKALGTKHIIPEYASVTNALGAVIGNIYTVSEIEIKPEYSVDGISSYTVFGKNSNLYIDNKEEAVNAAISLAREDALSEARNRGASGDIKVSIKITEDISKASMANDESAIKARLVDIKGKCGECHMKFRK